MTNEPEEYTPADAIRDAVAENMASGASPKPSPPMAEIPAKPAAPGPEAVQMASVSQADVAAHLPEAKAASGPEAVVSPAQEVRRLVQDANPDYNTPPEQPVRIQEQSAPLDLSPLLTAIKELSETIKTLKPEEKSESPKLEPMSSEKSPEKLPSIEVDADSRRRQLTRLEDSAEKRLNVFSPEERTLLDETWKKQSRDSRDQRQQQAPEMIRPLAQQIQPQAPQMGMGGGGQQQQPQTGPATGKFQQEMQKFLTGNSDALQQVLGVIETVTATIEQQNRQLSQVQSQVAQLSQFASSTMQRSQKAGYR